VARWYRAYEGTVADPKLAEAAMVAGCSRSVAVAAWHLILEKAAVAMDSGRFDCSPRLVAVALGEPLLAMEALVSAFADIGLTCDGRVTAWERRQYESDRSAGRTAKWREGKKSKEKAPCDVTGASPRRHRDAPDTESETEDTVAKATGAKSPVSERVCEPSLPAGPQPDAADFTRMVFGSGVAILTAVGKNDRQARSIIGRWRQTYSDSIVLAVLSRCQVMQPSEPVEWIAAALQHEARRAAGDRHGQSEQPARTGGAGLRTIGQRVAERRAAANAG
jgi:hypothetical protein